MIAILDLSAVDEYCHMVTKFALIVKNIAARLFMPAKIAFEHFAHSRPRHLTRRTGQVALNVLSESDRRHFLRRL